MQSRRLRILGTLLLAALLAAGCAGARRGSKAPAPGEGSPGSGSTAAPGPGGAVAPGSGGTAAPGSGGATAGPGAGTARSGGAPAEAFRWPARFGPIPGEAPAHAVTEPLQVPAALAKGVFAQKHLMTLPAGFHISLWATGLPGVRYMAVGPQTGDIYATLTGSGRVVRLSDPNHTGVATVHTIAGGGMDRPHGIAWHEGKLYVAENGRVGLFTDYKDGDDRANAWQMLMPIVGGSGHFTRTIVWGPDGMLYVSAGSTCNVCKEEDQRQAAISRYFPDGRFDGVVAGGLRNAVGIAFRPGTDELWAVVNGRDGLGDDVPPEQLDLVRQGDDFGWPVCHGFGITDPQFGNANACTGKADPMLAIQAHSAPLSLAFYDGKMFPAAYKGDLFIALHGSWNRKEPTGAKVIRVHMEGGRPVSRMNYENFITGWQLPDGSRWGRPVDLIVAPDGALLLSDDTSGSIYRITWDGGTSA